MLKRIALLYFTCLSFSMTFSQSLNIIKNEKLLLSTLQQEKFDIDSNAKAVYLYKSGDYSIIPGTTYTVEVIIKILSDDAARDLSWVNISKSDIHSTITNIKGETYNIENGKVVVQKMKNDEIKNENIIEDLKVYKFNLPSVKKGSIIHYSYKKFTEASVFIPDWYAQENYPVLYEEFSVVSPGTLTEYHRLERFFCPFAVLRNPDGLDTCTACVYSQETGTGFNIKWVRRNVPGFKKEPFMESEYNYKERIRLEYIYKYSDWGKFINAFLMGEDHHFIITGNPFPKVYQSNPYLNDKVEELTKNAKNDIEKASAIYKFVRDSFNVKNTLDGMTLKDCYKAREGTKLSINLNLTAMLRNAGLNAEPAFLCTRENEKLNPYYQEFRNVDFFFCRLILGKDTICLDASDKDMPFGKLPSNCYNGYSRTINKVSHGFNLTPNNITNKSNTIVSIKPSEDEKKLVLKADYKLGDYDAYAFRKAMKNDTVAIRKKIIGELTDDGMGFELTDLKVDNLTIPDAPLLVHIKAVMNLDPSLNMLYFDPFMDKIYDKNPFAAITRQYPVQMDYLEDKNYTFSFQLPSSYALDDYPKSIKYQYDDSSSISLKNLASFDPAQSLFTLNSRFISKNTTFAAEDYERIREFYNKAIEGQNEKMVIKVKNK